MAAKVVPVVNTKNEIVPVAFGISAIVILPGDLGAVAMIMPLGVECRVDSLGLVENGKPRLPWVTYDSF